MSHARSISKPLVSPCLSTRAIWAFLGDLISSKVSAHKSLAGLVLDISVVGMFVFTKAFDHFVQAGPASVLGVAYADNC